MNPIMFPLTALQPGDTGPTAANLHAILARVGLAEGIPAEELASQLFGPRTAGMVRRLFAMAGLGNDPAGAISVDAAAKLNEFLTDRRLLARVGGRLLDANGVPTLVTGLRVRVHDRRNVAGSPAADVEVVGHGDWQAWYDPAFYLEARPGVIERTDEFVPVASAFNRDGIEVARSEPTPNPEGRARIDLVMREEQPAEPVREMRRVRGWLLDSAGDALKGFAVEVYDRDIGPLRPDQWRGRYTTRENGSFEIEYDVAEVSAGDSPPVVADLVFRVTDTEGRPEQKLRIVRLPVESDRSITAELPVPDDELSLGIPARNDEYVRLVATTARAPTGPSEFDALMDALHPLLGGRSPAEMDEAANRDISFAARETGRDAGRIGDIAAAHRLASGVLEGVTPAPLYALMRTLELRDPMAIAQRSTKEIAEALKFSIPVLIADPGVAVNQVAAAIHRRAAQAALQMPVAEGARGSLAQALSAHLPDATEQASLMEDFAGFEGSTQEFWRAWAARHPGKPVEDIQFSLQLAAVTSHHSSLATAIQSAHPEVKTLRALALELDATKVAGMLAVAPPADLQPGESPEDGARRVANSVCGLLDAAHPTAAVARLAAGWAGEAPHAMGTGGAAVLRRLVLGTDYELGSGGLDKLAEAQADILFEGIEDPQERAGALADVQRIERLYNISTSAKALSAMATIKGPHGKSFKGAFDIASYGKSAFLAAFGDQPQDVLVELSSVHESAQLLAEAGSSLMLAALHESADPTIAAAKSQSVGASIPAWAQLFGSERLVHCDECRSLGGAAAYLVRILEFLDKRCPPNAAGATPLDVLIGNPAKGIAGVRPDIAHIKLSCENTDTTMPEIDLANEPLESHIVFGSSLASPPNDSSAGAGAGELAAAPENVQAKAYKTLAEAYFPVSLPFSRDDAETRAYLEQVGSNREEVIRLFRPDDADALARERLRLTALDHEILCGPVTAARPSPTLFGLPPQGPDPEAGWAVRLDASLPAAAAVLGLTVAELLALCSTRFISGAWSPADRDMLARLPLDVTTLAALRADAFATVPADIQEALDWVGLPAAELKSLCDRNATLLSRTIVVDLPRHTQLNEMHLVHLDGTALSEADWLNLHRMARLARRSGIAVTDLDLGLSALDAQAIDAKALQGLAALKVLGESLKLDWTELAALLGEPPPALWHRLFVASRVAKSDPVFLPNDKGLINPSPSALITDHAPALAAALDLQVPELIGLATALGPAQIDNAAITGLWRRARLASALTITTGELAQAIGLVGPMPTDAAGLHEYVETLKALKPALANALRMAAEEDAQALQQAVDALAKATDGIEKGPGRRRATLESLSQSFAVPVEMLGLLIEDPDSPDLKHLQQLSQLVGDFALKLSDVVVLKAVKAFQPVNANAQARFASFRRIQAYFQVARDRNGVRLALALAELASPNDASWGERVAAAIAACRPTHQGESGEATDAAVKGLVEDVKTIVKLPLSAPPPQDDPILALAWIDARLRTVAAAGSRASTLTELVSSGVGAGPALDELKRGVQARYAPDTWLQVSRLIHDPLRQARRDALVAFLKHDKQLGSDEAVFSELLLDPGVNSVVLTSRISNAMRTVQRFIHTVRLGMRCGSERPAAERVDAAQISPEWDLYLHSFRLTQANIEVLASPHFYMAPDLRDDKTPLFKEAEAFLRQNDATPDNVEHAFLTYLERLGEVSNLEICGTYLQEDFTQDEAFRFKSVLHVFGRSRGGTKRSYYYRRLNSYQHAEEWTPWEQVKVDIQGIERDRSTTRSKSDRDEAKPEAGVHLLPVVWRGKLHVFWPMVVRKVETTDEKPAINMEDGTSNAAPPRAYWEVKLCWSCLENGSWTPRQMSSDYHETFVLGFDHA